MPSTLAHQGVAQVVVLLTTTTTITMNSNNEVCCILFVVATLWTSLGSVVVVGQPAPNGPPGAPPIMLALPKVKNNFANNNNNNTGGPGGGGMDWLGLHQKICSLSESIVPGISKRFEECNKMSKFFQLEVSDRYHKIQIKNTFSLEFRMIATVSKVPSDAHQLRQLPGDYAQRV